MSRLSINELKARFATSDQPTQKDFADLIDTLLANLTSATVNPGQAYFYATATLSTATYHASYLPAVTSYVDGTILVFKADLECPAGPVSFEAGAGTYELAKQGNLALEKGDIQANQIVEVRFSATDSKWHVLSALYRSVGRAGDIIASSALLAGDYHAASGATRLYCDGAAYLRANYPDLFAALGGTSSPWGLPDGLSFNVPDMRRQVAVGVGPSSLASAGTVSPVNFNLGTRYGAESLPLYFYEMPPHYHGVGTVQNSGVGGDTPDENTIAFVYRPWGPGATWSERMSSGDGGRNMLAVANKSSGEYGTTEAYTFTGGAIANHSLMQPGVAFHFYILT